VEPDNDFVIFAKGWRPQVSARAHGVFQDHCFVIGFGFPGSDFFSFALVMEREA
jgi:hypothetical protein